MNRLCIYPKDIQIITGKSERQGRNIIAKIKQQLNKQKHQSVTIQEFCQYQGLDYEQVIKIINNTKTKVNPHYFKLISYF